MADDGHDVTGSVPDVRHSLFRLQPAMESRNMEISTQAKTAIVVLGVLVLAVLALWRP
jgi:hypothetical protein